MAGARVVRATEPGSRWEALHHGELLFWFVLEGGVVLERESVRHALGPADSVVLAPGERYQLRNGTADLEFLEVTLPA